MPSYYALCPPQAWQTCGRCKLRSAFASYRTTYPCFSRCVPSVEALFSFAVTVAVGTQSMAVLLLVRMLYIVA